MDKVLKRTPPDLPKNSYVELKRAFPQMKLSKVIDLINEKCGNLSMEKYGVKTTTDNTDVLIFLPMAYREFKTMIYWGENHPVNRYEQLYQGIGHIIQDGNRRIIIISHFMYIYAANRSPVSACIFEDKYDSILERLELEREIYVKNEKICNRKADGTIFDPFIEIAGPSEPVLYGHTHPNLGCFFSGPDRVSGFASTSLPAVTFVADPIRKDMKAGVGRELSDAAINCFSYMDTSSTDYEQGKKTIRLYRNNLEIIHRFFVISSKKQKKTNLC